MQHFGIATPLLDFTSRSLNALYFAVENIDYNSESSIEIGNYFSVYCNYQNNTAFEIFHEVYLESMSNTRTEVLDYEWLSNNKLLLISNLTKEFNILNNIRILNQQGLFIYNNDAELPLETVYKDFITFYKEEIGLDKFNELLMHDTIAICFNFHKKYAKIIKKILNDLWINDEFIYPRVETLKSYVDNLILQKHSNKDYKEYGEYTNEELVTKFKFLMRTNQPVDDELRSTLVARSKKDISNPIFGNLQSIL